ncbi:MAG: Do family serine endopeptidase [Acidobacteriota bacterium]
MYRAGEGRIASRPGLPLRPAALLALATALLGVLLLLVVPRFRPARVSGAPRDPAGRAAGSEVPGPTAKSPAAPVLLPPSGPLAGGAARDGYADVVRPVLPAVVNISSVRVVQTYERLSPFFADPFFRHFFGDQFYDYVVPRERRVPSLGSGVIVDPGGTILTNNHVVEHADEVNVSLADGREMRARILGTDARTDLAVLRVSAEALPHAVLGDSDGLEVGDVVLAIGNPFGLGRTVTMGIVSAIGRGNIGVADYEDFIQTDAAINPGNSGGALVNTRGEVVGINTAIYTRSGGYQGIGFAIPSSMARGVLESILEHGRVIRGYAGIGLQRITPEIARAFGLADTRGALVAVLDPEGPAARAGLRRGDVIVSVRGRPVISVDDLRTRLSRFKPGEQVEVGLLRDGRRLEIDLTLVEPPPVRSPPRRRR